jgi:hypothetical protein
MAMSGRSGLPISVTELVEWLLRIPATGMERSDGLE